MSDTPRTDRFLQQFTMSRYASLDDLRDDKLARLLEWARSLERECASYERATEPRPEAADKIRNDALEEAAQIALRRTEIPSGAKHPTRDQVVIVGEEVARLIRDAKREPQDGRS